MRRIFAIILLLVPIGLGVYFFVLQLDEEELVYAVIFLLSILILGVLINSFFGTKKEKKIKWLENRLEVWNSVSYHVKRAGDEAFNELPVGIIIFDEDNEIKWANRYAKAIFQNKLVEKQLNTIHKELNEMLQEGSEQLKINVFDKIYDIIYRKEYRIIYFFDVTYREEVILKYKNRAPAMGILYLDNIEESLHHLDVQERSNLRGQYLGLITDYVSKFGGYLKSYDDDRMFILCNYQQLQEMIKDKFDILNQIRDISTKNQVRVTASLGLACWDIKLEELGAYAQNAIELAEKRGGDQVVVNVQGEKIQYFGGKTNSLEKSSRVHVRAKTQEFKDLVEASDNILIMGHTMMDLDSFGAVICTLKMVIASNKEANIIVDREKLDVTVTKNISNLNSDFPHLGKYIITSYQALNLLRENTLLIVVDTQSPKIVMDQTLLSKAQNVAVIDHHRRGEESFENARFVYIEPYASSSVELTVEMSTFYNKKIDITVNEASLMLGGIIVDTNDFTFRTGARTFEVASILKEYGADMIKVRTMLRESLSRQLEISELVSNVEMIENRFAVTFANEIKDRVMLAQVSEQLLKIEGVDAAFTICPISHEAVGVSARSYENVNVQLIMEELGGGGHFNGAAAQFKNKTIDEVKNLIIEILRRDYIEIGDEKMKVILLEDVKGRGSKNDIIEVANGYGNFLLVNKKAIVANNENIKSLKDEQEKAIVDAQNYKDLMLKLKGEIENKSLVVYIKTGEEGKLFGSITTKQICDEFENQTGIKLDKRKVHLSSEINSLGIYTAFVQLHKEVTAQIEVNVLEK